MSHKYIFVYKTTNQVNSKFYYGVHRTNDLNDGYIGSGKRLKDAIKHYGREKFTREIIKYFDTFDAALAYEREIVTHELVENTMRYNMTIGGNCPPNWGSTGPRPDASIRMKTNNPVHLPGMLERLKGNVTVIDKNGKTFSVKNYDPRYLSGELVSVNKGRTNPRAGEKLEQMTCPHCGKVGAGGSMKRWHFDNCKERPWPNSHS